MGAYRQACQRDLAGLRVGVPTEYFGEGLDAEVAQAVRGAIDELRRQGAEIVDVSLPHTKYAVATYYLICTAEASSNLARYDGVRFGHRAEQPAGSARHVRRTRHQGFGAEVKRRIMLGTFALSAGYYDAYYRKAQRVRTLIRRDFEQAFERCDVIARPTSPVPAFKLGERVDDPLQMYLADVFTISCNLAGSAGLSLPCGFTAQGLPIGLQLHGPALRRRGAVHRGRGLRAGHASGTSAAARWRHERCAPVRAGHRARGPRPAGHRHQALLWLQHPFGAAAQHARSVRSAPGSPACCRCSTGGRVEYAVKIGAGHRLHDPAAQPLCPQELLLPRSAQGLSDLPVRRADRRARRRGHLARRTTAQPVGIDPHPHGRGRGQEHPRPGNAVAGRPQPCRRAAGRDRQRARHPHPGRGRRVHAHLRSIVRALGISDGNMEQGSLRCDANISVRPRGQRRSWAPRPRSRT